MGTLSTGCMGLRRSLQIVCLALGASVVPGCNCLSPAIARDTGTTSTAGLSGGGTGSTSGSTTSSGGATSSSGGSGGCGLRTCESVGANCGPIGDGCGSALQCGN